MPRPHVGGIVAVMSITTGTTRGPGREARGIRTRLSPRARKLTLLVHLASAGSWLGLDLVLGILVATVLASGDATTAGAAALSLASVATWPLVIVGTTTLVSGLVLGLGTNHGLTRYWWVLAKLVLNVVLVALVLVLLRPGVVSVGEAGRQALGAGTSPEVGWNLLFPPVVSSTAVIFAMTLAVFKPWGRIRRAAG